MNKINYSNPTNDIISTISKSKTLRYSFALIIVGILQTGCASKSGGWELPITIVNHGREVYPNKDTRKNQHTENQHNGENENIETLNKLISDTLIKIKETKAPQEKRALQEDLRFYISSLNDLTNSERNIESINKSNIQELGVQIGNSSYNAPQMRSDKQRMEKFKRAGISYRYYDTQMGSKHFDKLSDIYYSGTRSRFNGILEDGEEIDLSFLFGHYRENFSLLLEDNKLIIKHQKTGEEKIIFLNKNRYNHKKRVNATFGRWQNEQDGYEVNISLELSF